MVSVLWFFSLSAQPRTWAGGWSADGKGMYGNVARLYNVGLSKQIKPIGLEL